MKQREKCMNIILYCDKKKSKEIFFHIFVNLLFYDFFFVIMQDDVLVIERARKEVYLKKKY